MPEEQDKEFEAIWARDGSEAMRKSSSIKALCAFWFALGKKQGSLDELRDMPRVVDQTAARAL